MNILTSLSVTRSSVWFIIWNPVKESIFMSFSIATFTLTVRHTRCFEYFYLNKLVEAMILKTQCIWHTLIDMIKRAWVVTTNFLWSANWTSAFIHCFERGIKMILLLFSSCRFFLSISWELSWLFNEVSA